MKISFILFFVSFFSFTTLFAQSGNSYKTSDGLSSDSTAHLNIYPLPVEKIKTEKKVNWHQMITNVPSDFSNFPKGAFSNNKFPLFAVVAAGTGALMLIDQKGWDENKRLYNNSDTFHELSDMGVNFGDEKYHFMMAGVFAVFGFVNDSPAALKTASNIVEAVIASGIGVQVLKRIFGRESPAVSSQSSGRWQFFPNLKKYQENQPKYYAYPSGHITTLTATVTVIANNYPQEKWIKPIGYSMIGLCGIGLVSRGMHWYSDLPLGIFLGYTFGNLIAPPESDSKASFLEKGLNKVKVSPLFFSGDIGFSLSYNF